MATNSKGYDPNKDYSAAIEAAKAAGASQTVINQLQTERQNKINDVYGGNEPTMYGSNQTYSQASSSGNQSAINNAVNTYNQYSGTTSTYDPWAAYAGTNFHQDAINAAQAGDWDAVVNYLAQREEKTTAQGDNRGKTSAEIYAELWDLYGTQEPTFEFDTSSRPTYNDNGLSSKIDAMLNQILNRDKFSYNAAEDDLYKQYAAMYEREGTRAMNDAMASAAATAGGMNSYAMTAANQANNYYMAQLNDKIPELYQLAYEMYLQDIDNQVRDLGLLQTMDDTQYNRYRDTMKDWESDRNFAFDIYQSDVQKDQWQQSFDSSNDHWQQEFDAANDQWQQTFDHTVGQDALAQQNRDEEWDYTTGTEGSNTAYAKAMDLLNAGAMPDAAMLKEAGMTEDQAATILAAVKAEMDGVVTSGSTGSPSGSGSDNGSGSDKKTGGGYDNSGVDTNKIKEMQRKLGVTDDGLWGAKTQEAAKAAGWSTNAADAWKAYQNGEYGYVYNGVGKYDDYVGTNETSSQTTSFGSYDDATKYLNKQGIPSGDISGLMTYSEWTRRKSSLANYGTGGAEVTAYDTYPEYLSAYVQYLMEKNGK